MNKPPIIVVAPAAVPSAIVGTHLAGKSATLYAEDLTVEQWVQHHQRARDSYEQALCAENFGISTTHADSE